MLSINLPVLVGQLLIGLINGAFYAMLSLGLAVIFGLLNIINFTHGAQYMLGAFCAYLLLTVCGIGYWPALVIAPLVVGAIGIVIERTLLRHVYSFDPLYGLILTLGLALVLEGIFRQWFGLSGQPYPIPHALTGIVHVGRVFLPRYRIWVVLSSAVACIAVWFAIERTALGARLRAASENAALTRAFGIRVERMITLTYGFGVALAAFAGVLAAPIYQVSPLMGSDLIVVVFAVVVIGGLGSIMGAIAIGFALGLVEGLVKAVYPEGGGMAVFLIMALVLLLKPTGLFGGIREAPPPMPVRVEAFAVPRALRVAFAVAMLGFAVLAPFFSYPIFLMRAWCLALFACAFNLLMGFAGVVSLGHAAFFGVAGYVTAYGTKIWGWPPEAGIAAGVLVAALLGLVIGWLAIRRSGIYLSMVTLALAQLIYFIATEARDVTGGDQGIAAVPRGWLFGVIDLNQTIPLYYVVLACFLLGFALIARIVRSPFGHVLRAIGENEPRAISLGYDVDRYKLAAFILSAALAGLAGSLKAIVFQFASLTDLHFDSSGQVMLMALLGGVGTLFGPVIGAFVVVAIESYLTSFGSWVTIIEGAIFVACVLAFRRGIVGEILHALSRREARRKRRHAAPVGAIATHDA